MKSVLITGSNRGIGLGFVKKIASLTNPPEHIFATCRNPSNATELQDLAKSHSNIHVVGFDVKDSKNYDKLVKLVSDKVGDNGLNVLINNAGIISSRGKIDDVIEEELIEVYKVNTVAPIMLTKAFLPLLRKAGEKVSGPTMGVSRAVIVNVSSQVGSIDDNGSGGMYGYRCSKVALNMATKNMSIELKQDGILAICIHPGWVQTDMGGPNAKITVEDSVDAMVRTIMNLKAEDNGAFLRFNGETIAW